MMLPIKLLDEAELEGAKAIDWYAEREPGLGIAFRESVDTSNIVYSEQLTDIFGRAWV